MSSFDSARRDLLKLSGLGLVAAAGSISPAAAASPKHPSSAPSIFDVRAFGATGDGKSIDTGAINKAIEAASAAGGGTVLFPPGTYVAFSIHLRSFVDLYLSQGCTILAAESPKPGEATGYMGGGYDVPEPDTAWNAYQDFGHNHWHNSLMWGEDLHDLSITGPGLIWGKGLSAGHGNHVLPNGVGDKSITLKNCRNVTLRDFSMLKGGHIGILLTAVDNVTIDNLRIDTDRDGIDIDCCRNVRVSNCTVNSPEDDAICLKSSFGLGYARSTDNVTVTNCYVTGKYEIGTLLDGTFKKSSLAKNKAPVGRIKCGTESNGGFRNITISNCVFEGCRGLALESADGALLEDVAISNITMRECTNTPLFLRLCARMRGPENVPIGTLRRIFINNIVSYNSGALYPGIIAGIPGSLIEDVNLSDIYFHQIGGGDKEMAELSPDEQVKGYPDPDRFRALPAYGLFLRHIKNLQMTNVEFALAQPDARPAIWAHDVQGLDIFRLRTPATTSSNFALREVTGFRVFGSPHIKDVAMDEVETKSF